MVICIRAENLGVSYDGENIIWSGLNVEINEPGLVAILGPNGVGKSTFMYTINKLLTPMEGQVTLDGVNVQDMEYKDIAKKIAYVPQASNETFSMPVIDTVLMGRYPHSGYNLGDDDLRIAANCLRVMNMQDFAMRGFDELSAGQHQKVMIARGLAQEPQILMLDEPTSNLDIYHQIYVMKLLRDIAHRRNIIVMVICHDLNVASRFSDRILLFSKGTIYTEGTPEKVITEDNIRNVYGVTAEVTKVDDRPYVIFHADESMQTWVDDEEDVPSEKEASPEPVETKRRLFSRGKSEV